MRSRWMATVAAAAVLVTGLAVPIRASVLYDEESGIPLAELLAEDATAWSVAAPVDTALQVNAKGAVLMDQASGKVLHEQGAHERLPIASVTKVMTLLLVMEALASERIAWTDAVSCSNFAASMGGSQIWLEPGEIMTVEELVKAAAVVSANDACVALAEHISGTADAFVAAMNARAKELGMADTQFVDCSGLDDSGYSCAYDVALMSRELMKHKDIQRFTTIWMDTLRGGESQLVNTNKLVRHYTGATGLKTGTTQAAGHCLAATAERDGTAFVAVVLGSPTTADRFDGARAMLDYGFSGYVSYVPPVEEPAPIPVLRGQSESVELTVDTPAGVLLRKGTEKEVQTAVEIAEDLEAPVEMGQIVGTWRLSVGDEIVSECAIRTACSVSRITFGWAYSMLLHSLLQ